MSESDIELLQRFVREDSQDAFTELVQRHLDLVYSAAKRQVHSPQLAEEVAQSVFIDLARQAKREFPEMPLAAWLYVVTRRTAIDAIRRDARRTARERAAAEISVMNSNSTSAWPQIEPLLDEAMAGLSAPDRSAIVLRYFENKSLREVGEALNASEDAAQKRVTRAIDQLRGWFSKRGISVGSTALATDLASHAVEAAPLGLGVAISTGATSSSAATAVSVILMTTSQKTLITAALLLALGAGLYQFRVNRGQQSRIDELQVALTGSRGREQQLRSDRDELLRRQAQVVPTAMPPAATQPVSPTLALPTLAMSRADGGLAVINGRDGMLAESFLQAFGLRDDEKETIQAAIKESRARLVQLSANNSRISDGPNGGLTVTIEPFAEGQAVFEGILKTFESVLGPERYATFVLHYQPTGRAFGWDFGGFGTGVRTLTIGRKMMSTKGTREGPGPEEPHFSLLDSISVPTGGNLARVTYFTDLSAAPQTTADFRELLAPFTDRMNAMPVQGQ